jgi:hypothetical protein
MFFLVVMSLDGNNVWECICDKINKLLMMLLSRSAIVAMQVEKHPLYLSQIYNVFVGSHMFA